MQHGAVKVVREYAEAVFRRAREPMEPLNFEINWEDQPSRHKTYPGTTRVPLATDPAPLVSLQQLLDARPSGDHPPGERWTLDRLATLLRLSYGVLDRRLAVNWNQDLAKRTHFPDAVWGRGTASGGGMYPVEIYLVAGASGPLLPGVYHYATGQHCLERLLTGDVTPVVRAAAPDADPEADLYLLASIRFWKNSFKYNSFCYHVVTQDLGALLGSWDLISQAVGAPLQRVLSFDPTPLDGLLGFDSDAESIFAVIPLPDPDSQERAGAARPATGNSPLARVAYVPFERSRTVLTFPQITEVHRAAMAPLPPTAAEELHTAAPVDLPGAPMSLPPVESEQLNVPLSTVLCRRQSSFGRFRRPPELTVAEVGTTLAFAASGRHYRADVKQPDGGPALTRLWLFANHVDGLTAGTYAYCPGEHALLPVKPPPEPDMSTFLQQHYFLSNYTMAEVGAVIAISGRLDAVLASCGPRGYRILNAEVGTVAQYVYCATAAQGIGCGAVLGFDNVAMNEALGIETTDEQTVLFLLIGHQSQQPAELTYQL